jgi:hypothetical protein
LKSDGSINESILSPIQSIPVVSTIITIDLMIMRKILMMVKERRWRMSTNQKKLILFLRMIW